MNLRSIFRSSASIALLLSVNPGHADSQFGSASGVLSIGGKRGNITVLPPSALPPPTPTTAGGVMAGTAPSHQFLNGIDGNGRGTSAQPQAGDVAGLAASATIDATDASNITTGIFTSARLPYYANAAAGSVARSILSKLSDAIPSVADFGIINGNGTTDNTATFLAADAVGTRVSLPPGRYKTNGTSPFQLSGSVYTGPGQVILDGYAQAPFRSNITSALPNPLPSRYQTFDVGCLYQYRCSYATVANTGSPYTNFTGNGSTASFTTSFAFPPGYALSSIAVGVNGALQQLNQYSIAQNSNNTVTVVFATAPPSAARITVSEPYQSLFQYSSDREVFENVGGFNADLANQNIGRSGIAAHQLDIEQGGQGDLTGINVTCSIYGQKFGSTHIFANPACQLYGGSISAQAPGAYLQPYEWFIQDNGNDAGTAAVRDFIRTVTGSYAQGHVWVGERMQSGGSVAADAAYAPSGLWRRIFDTTSVNLDSDQAAATFGPGQRVYFNAISAGDNVGTKWFATTLNAQYTDFNPTTGNMETVNGTGSFGVTPSGALTTTGPAVSVTSCGSSAVVTDANSSRGTIQVGTGASGCTILFPSMLPKRPVCTVTSEGGKNFTYYINSGGIALTNGTGSIAGDVIDYKCEL